VPSGVYYHFSAFLLHEETVVNILSHSRSCRSFPKRPDLFL
jgi:hypothetical protein